MIGVSLVSYCASTTVIESFISSLTYNGKLECFSTPGGELTHSSMPLFAFPAYVIWKQAYTPMVYLRASIITNV